MWHLCSLKRCREDSIDEVTFENSLTIRVGVPRVTRGWGQRRVHAEIWRRENRVPSGNRKMDVCGQSWWEMKVI